MNFATWSIRYPVPSLLLFILLTILGLFGFNRLVIQKFPDMDLPAVTVVAALEGAAPAQLETEVARKIEDKIAAISRLDHINTTITDGSVVIVASFDIAKNGEEALNEVRNAVDGVRAELPSEMTAPTVSKVTSANSPLLTFTAHSDKLNEQELSWFVDNTLAKAMLAVKGVAQVGRVGGVSREIQVDLDPALMAGLGVSPADISSRLRSVEKDASGGRGELGNGRQSMRTLGAAASVDQIAALSIALADGRRIRLDQVARISDSHAERGTLAYFNGKPVIGFQITRSKGFSDLSVATSVRTAVTRFSATHPELEIHEAYNTVTPVEDNYRGSMQLLYEGAFLAVLVVWAFLRDWRATLVAATAIPISVIPTFAAMYMAGFSLNIVSLLAISLVVGILVDDAIVEIENIERHMRAGKSPLQAAADAATEIGLAVIATTLTLVAVFLPTAFMSGVSGIIFRQFGITAAAAVLMSLLVARLLTPMMSARFLKAPPADSHPQSALMTRYLGWVRVTLTHRKTTLAVALASLLLALALIPLIPTEFMPIADDGQIQVSLSLPAGSTLDDTDRVARRAAALVREVRETTDIFIAVGSTSENPGLVFKSTVDARSATLTVNLKPRGERDRVQSAVEAEMRERLRRLPGARIYVGSAAGGDKLDLTLASDDPLALAQATAVAEPELRSLKGIGNVTSSAALQQPEVQIVPNDARAASLGVSTASLAELVRVATSGDFSTSLARLNLPQRQIPIRVRVDPAVRNNLDAIGQLRVAGSNGSVAVASVAEVRLGSGPAQIDRIDRERNVKLSVELNGHPLGEINKAAQALPSIRNLPPGVHIVEQGALQHMKELFGDLIMAMAIGIFCIYAVLVLLFHDFLQPVTILAALPLSIGGAVLSLIVTHSSFSISTLIGLMLLMGIVSKNSILLVEYAVMARREHGMSRIDALMDACGKRARPIVMTTVALTAGMMPVALGLGADPSFRQPMAIVAIGGAIASTALSLLVIPVVFTYVDDLLQWVDRRGANVGAAQPA